MTGPAPLFSVVVPTLGHPSKLDSLLDALERQTLSRDRWDLIVSFDGAAPSGETSRRLGAWRARIETLAQRRGPGAARNAAARSASGEILAFTEDDCVPAPTWLESAAGVFAREPSLDVLEGATLLPDGRPARRRNGNELTWLPTNLFVRRRRFLDAGGYCEDFFDARSGIYFREDSDFGFTLEEKGARAAYNPAPQVAHPREHEAFADPIRWARRYEMDPLLQSRHPTRFRERIEVSRWGPFVVRRPFVRACAAHVIAVVAAVTALVLGDEGVASAMALFAALLVLALWAKWRFAPARLLVLPAVPWLLIASLFRGAWGTARRRAAR
jgi:glycosyltransferase involved in cell wall biosynthesis